MVWRGLEIDETASWFHPTAGFDSSNVDSLQKM
jgi:hypothetical protein